MLSSRHRAELRARADVAKNFETYSAYLMRDYAASTTAGDFTRNTEEQNVERAIKTFAAVTLSGVRPVDRYKDEKTGTYYVLVVTDRQNQVRETGAESNNVASRSTQVALAPYADLVVTQVTAPSPRNSSRGYLRAGSK